MKKVTVLTTIFVVLAMVFAGCTTTVKESVDVEATKEAAEEVAREVAEETHGEEAEGEAPSEEVDEEEPEVTYEYEEREILCSNQGKNIYGRAFVPIGAGEKMPTVIFCHGFAGSFIGTYTIADVLATKGIASYSFDFCGGSPKNRSDGDMTEMSIFTEQSDLNAVIDMVKALGFVDADNLFIYGESQGGLVVAITANERPDEIKGLMLQYPAFVIPDDAREKFDRVDDIPEELEVMGCTLGKVYYENLLDYDVYSNIDNYTNDVLIFHGDADTLVDLSYSQQALEIYSSAELVVFEEEGHHFSRDAILEVADMAYDYIIGE